MARPRTMKNTKLPPPPELLNNTRENKDGITMKIAQQLKIKVEGKVIPFVSVDIPFCREASITSKSASNAFEVKRKACSYGDLDGLRIIFLVKFNEGDSLEMLNGLSDAELEPLVEVIGGMQDEIDLMMAEGRPFFLLCLQNLLPYKTVPFSGPFTRPSAVQNGNIF